MKDYSLYLITSQDQSGPKKTFQIAKEAAASGIDLLQMREKTMSKNELLDLAKKLSTLSKENNIVFIVNDDPYLAKEVNSDGVHLGQEDLLKFGIKESRKILGPNKIIGISTHSLDQVKAANRLDINYIGFGPIFETKTKGYSLGIDQVKEVINASRFPVVLIGGINLNNIEQLLMLGAKNFAMIREITQSPNIADTISKLKTIINRYRDAQ